jgi:chromosome partitioning protein
MPKMLEGLNRLRVIHPRMTVLGVILTMVQNDMPESRESVEALRGLLPQELVLRTVVPRDSLFLRASARGLPVGVMDEGGGAQAVFDSLRSEIEAKLKVPGRQPQIG